MRHRSAWSIDELTTNALGILLSAVKATVQHLSLAVLLRFGQLHLIHRRKLKRRPCSALHEFNAARSRPVNITELPRNSARINSYPRKLAVDIHSRALWAQKFCSPILTSSTALNFPATDIAGPIHCPYRLILASACAKFLYGASIDDSFGRV